MTSEAKYLRQQAAEVTGLSSSRIQYLATYKVVTPQKVQIGSGRRERFAYLYTAKDLENLKLIAKVDRMITSHGLKKAIALGKLAKLAELIGDD
jgi:DNA-binding transcriptional MerR regulator